MQAGLFVHFKYVYYVLRCLILHSFGFFFSFLGGFSCHQEISLFLVVLAVFLQLVLLRQKLSDSRTLIIKKFLISPLLALEFSLVKLHHLADLLVQRDYSNDQKDNHDSQSDNQALKANHLQCNNNFVHYKLLHSSPVNCCLQKKKNTALFPLPS